MTVTAPAIAAVLGSGSYNGLSWGPGTDFHISDVKGLDDLPAVRTSDAPRAADHGVWRGIDVLDRRVVQLDFAIIAKDNPTLFADVAQAEAAFQPQLSTELPLLLFGSTRLVYCRCRRRDIPYDASIKRRTGTMTVELHAADPRVYDANQTTLLISPPIGATGAAWPWTFPLSWGGAATTGSASVTNTGNFETRPVITIKGPCTNPTISNQSLMATLTFNITLAGVDQLVIDTDARSVVLNGTASRRATLVTGSTWWTLPPGTSTLAFGAQSTSSGCMATVTYRNAWV